LHPAFIQAAIEVLLDEILPMFGNLFQIIHGIHAGLDS
jgi:hypothetical protein